MDVYCFHETDRHYIIYVQRIEAIVAFLYSISILVTAPGILVPTLIGPRILHFCLLHYSIIMLKGSIIYIL